MRFTHEIQAGLIAGVVLVVRQAQSQGCDPMFVAGVLALAEHRALSEGLDWPAMLNDASEVLGIDARRLLDRARQLGAGQR